MTVFAACWLRRNFWLIIFDIECGQPLLPMSYEVDYVDLAAHLRQLGGLDRTATLVKAHPCRSW